MKLNRELKPAARRKSPAIAKRKPAALEPAEAPARMTATARSAAKPVTIEAKIDVGFGNALYLRGEGAGLTWEQGIPLTCVDGSTWKWTGEIEERLKFKLLLNDRIWANGEDLVANAGERIQMTPTFC